MTAAGRLAGFAAAIAAVFGIALAIGSQFDLAVGADHGSMGGNGSMGGQAGMQATSGLAVSEGGYTLVLARDRAPLDSPFTLVFRIIGPDGTPVRDFDVEHTKRLHLIVVRRDMAGFQHVHPRDVAGVWSTRLTLPLAGTYRVFADFSSHGAHHVLAADLAVDGTVINQPLPSPAPVTTVDGYSVSLAHSNLVAGHESTLSFTVTRNGQQITPAPYLGALGHLVALRAGDLAFLHVHPADSSLDFMADLPSAGTYRLFLQFLDGGVVHTAPFTIEVGR